MGQDSLLHYLAHHSSAVEYFFFVRWCWPASKVLSVDARFAVTLWKIPALETEGVEG